MLITAAVLAETCSALPAAGSIYLYLPQMIELIVVVGQPNLVVQSTDVCLVSWQHGGHPLPGQRSVPPILKAPQISFSQKSMPLISPLQQTLMILNFAPFNGLYQKFSSQSQS